MIGQPAEPASVLGRLLALLLPTRCLGCGVRGAQLCDTCESTIPWLGGAVCPRCAAASRQGYLCADCRIDSGPLDAVRAACVFEGVVRQAVHDLKYRQARMHAELLGEIVARALAAQPLRIDVLAPVPLARRRCRERGYNQSAAIARAVGRRTGTPVEVTCLERTRETPPQVGRTAAARRVNVDGAFTCTQPEAVAGRWVAVIDDVMTTGSTLRACALPLKAAGAERVFGLVVARER
ncbi:MAG: ComF family protein [Chloroflexi bacterium]|nr:ComF family protein [Chloroflexota bacterium]